MKEESKGSILCNGPEKGVCCTHIRTERRPESGVPKVGWGMGRTWCEMQEERNRKLELNRNHTMGPDLGRHMLH